jgi:hypothetical protein
MDIMDLAVPVVVQDYQPEVEEEDVVEMVGMV